MSASIHRFSCHQLGLCQQRQPACEGCVPAPQGAQHVVTPQASSNLGGGNFWLDGHRVSPLADAPDPFAGQDDDETDAELGWIIVRVLGWLALGLCALVGAGTLAGMAWHNVARWLA
jgi:hypothetical protein